MIDKNNREYTNGEITVYWKPSLCCHSGICYTELVDVFDPRKRPWIDMKGADTAAIINTVGNCPTDALKFKYNKDIENFK